MYEVLGPIWSFEFIKKEEGTLPDLYFEPENLIATPNSDYQFKIKTSLNTNIYGFDIRFSYNPQFINININDCIPDDKFNNNDFHIIKKINEYNDHNEFIFSAISKGNNFILPEDIIDIKFSTINIGETKIKFEKSTYMFGENETEILFSVGDSIAVTISE
ncbi:hypothetical protein [Marinitoga litoralis]|uniref:hypothetical protein n=1 Tax=Marinitoga litoralis TaxID=570855 RepID=UPI0019615B15|nr:hypothetical protein [Marinitoga litoralis]MBM7559547.1 hypothetical protein [Marinitoga litoralis]